MLYKWYYVNCLHKARRLCLCEAYIKATLFHTFQIFLELCGWSYVIHRQAVPPSSDRHWNRFCQGSDWPSFLLYSLYDFLFTLLIHPSTYYGNVNPNGVRSCYDEEKRIAETLCCDYRRIYNTNVKIARIFNTYGPYMRQDDGRVISNFVNAILDEMEIIIYGNGEQTRSLCYVTDMVDGLIALMNSNVYGPINLGNPTELSVNELAELLKKKMKSDIPIRHCEELENDPKKRKPDISLAMKELKWFPKISLDQGISKTINYYKAEKASAL